MSAKNLRIGLLLLILAYVGIDALLSNIRSTDWTQTLRVVVYPINADQSELAQRAIESLDKRYFNTILRTVQREATHYGIANPIPIDIAISDQVLNLPPPIPQSNNPLATILWSLQISFWSWKNDNYDGATPQIKAYALFFDPTENRALKHSTGLAKSKIAIVNLFAGQYQIQQNNFVMLHEILHTLGATDKYDLSNNLPIYPDGFAEPNRTPLYPQKIAEVMGGYIPLSATRSSQPSGLGNSIIGPKTAFEIGWVKR